MLVASRWRLVARQCLGLQCSAGMGEAKGKSALDVAWQRTDVCHVRFAEIREFHAWRYMLFLVARSKLTVN